MATQRKSRAARGGNAKTARKPALKSSVRRSPAKKARTFATKTKSKTAAKSAKPAPAAKSAPAAKPAPPAKPAPAAKKKPAAPAPARRAAARPEPPRVQPIGVLPPEAMARSTHRPARAAALVTRPTRPPTLPPVSGDGEALTAEDLVRFEERLRADRQKILKDMGHLESTVLKVNPRDSVGDLSGYSFHMADVGTDAMEREKAFLFASTEGRLLLEINQALRRIYGGEYGVCEECTLPIRRARLEAVPHARLCLACKEKEEKAAKGLG